MQERYYIGDIIEMDLGAEYMGRRIRNYGTVVGGNGGLDDEFLKDTVTVFMESDVVVVDTGNIVGKMVRVDAR